MKDFFTNLKPKFAAIWQKRKRRIIIVGVIITSTLIMTQCPKQGAVILKHSAEITDVLIELL